MNSNTPTSFNLGEATRLRQLLDRNERAAIDTEFMRERTYFSQLCLIQIATPANICCIDPLAEGDRAGIEDSWRAMLDIPWVLHSGRQDIEVIYQTANAMPVSVFDTQVAAGLLGYQPQIGYGNLVSELFDVQLAKSQTRADWSMRPLSADMLQYAAEDVLYLLPAYDTLCEKLDKQNRLDWALQDSADLLQLSLYDINTELAVDRLKGARNLRGRSFNIASRLSTWREHEALRRNLPRQWIMKDNVILEIAVRQPDSLNALSNIEGMPGRTAQRAEQELLAAVRDGLAAPDSHVPTERPTEQQKSMAKKLQARVTKAAEESGVASELIAPRKEITAAAVSDDLSGRVFRGWRAELVGDDLKALLRG